VEPIRAVHVYVHGVRAGELVLLNDELQEFVFRYDSAWLVDPARPTLGQLFEDLRPGPIRSSGLPGWFAHLLPGGVWKRHLKRWARLHVGGDEAEDDFTLLALLGQDLPGALTLEPALRNLAGDSLPAAPLEIPEDAVRFSLAGMQWKLSVKRGERGLTVPGVGEAGRYIAKFEDPDHAGLPRVEWATTEWARRAGVLTHRAELTPLSTFRGLPEGIPQRDGDFLLWSALTARPPSASTWRTWPRS
jgi:serine/threonine-protein kinase HipA